MVEANGRDSVVFSNTEPVSVPEMRHEKGPGYHFHGPPRNKWMWREMVAQLDADSMNLVVGPGSSCTDGLVSCRLQQTDRYDHMREHARAAAATVVDDMGYSPPPMLRIWDFVLVRADGSQV